MNISQFERADRGDTIVLKSAVADENGEAGYELLVSGREELISEVLGQSDFGIEISPGGNEEDFRPAFERLLEAHRPEPQPPGSAEHADYFKPKTCDASSGNTVVVELRRLKNGGTFYGAWLPLFVPGGANLVFLLPPVCVTAGMLIPSSGDPDVFLSLNGLGSVVAASTRPGTAVDQVSFRGSCWPWDHVVPFYRVFGFRASTCWFGFGGWGLP